MFKASSAVVALAVAAAASLATSPGHAADPPSSDRSVAGERVPSTGVTVPEQPAQPKVPSQTRAPRSAKATAGSLSGGQASNCDVLRARYRRSQSCFAPYRLQNGGIKPEAFKFCKQVPNPSLKCGSAVIQ